MKNTIPWGISTVLLTIPILLVTDSVVPATEVVQENGDKDFPVVLRYVLSFLTLVCVAAAIIWQRVQVDSFQTPAVDTYNTLQNLITYKPNCPHPLPSNPPCCCALDHLPIKYKDETISSGCVPLSCAERIHNGFDCCGIKLTANNIFQLSGKYMCVNGSVPSTL